MDVSHLNTHSRNLASSAAADRSGVESDLAAKNTKSRSSNPRAVKKILDLGSSAANEHPRIPPGSADLGVDKDLGTVHAKNTNPGISNPDAAKTTLDFGHSFAKEPVILTQHQSRSIYGIADVGAKANLGTVHAQNTKYEILNPGAAFSQPAKLMNKAVTNKPREEIKTANGIRDQAKARGRSRPAQRRFPQNPVMNAGGSWVIQGRSYASLMNSNPLEKKLKLQYVEPQKDEEGSCFFEPNPEVWQEAVEKWNDYAVGYFVSDKMPYAVVERIAKGFWAKLGLSEVLADSSGFFYFKISDATNRRNVLEGGPWMFQGRPIILQQWTPNMVMCKQSHDKIPLWVRIHRLPLALWTGKGLSGVASLIGRPLYADAYTEEMTRISFARICIEVSASKPLPETVEVKLGGNVVCLKVDYQWQPLRCEECCVFGHHCKKKLVEESAHQKEDAGKFSHKAQTDSEGFMVVKRRKNITTGSSTGKIQITDVSIPIPVIPVIPEALIPVIHDSSDEDGNEEAYDAIVNNSLSKDTRALLEDGKSEDPSSSEEENEENEGALHPKNNVGPVETTAIPLKKNSVTALPEATAQENPVVALPAAIFSEHHITRSKGEIKKKGRTPHSQLLVHADPQTVSSDEDDTAAMDISPSSQYDAAIPEVQMKETRRETRQQEKKNQSSKQETQPQSVQTGGLTASKPKRK